MTATRVGNIGWDDARVATLKKLYADGLSASQIANELGHVTRNAVIGKLSRLGMVRHADAAPPRSIAPRPPPPPKPVIVQPAAVVRGGGRALSAKRAINQAVANLANAPTPGPTAGPPGGVGILELSPRECKFPVNAPPAGHMETTLFCGAPRRDDSPYCPGHHRVCFQPRVDKPRKPRLSPAIGVFRSRAA